MNGAQLFALIEPAWRANMASRIPQRVFDQFLAEERAGLIEMLDAALAVRRARTAEQTQDADDPPELWTKSQRTKANLAALRIIASKKPEDLTPGERRQLLAYSSWGGLSLEEVKDQLPAGLEPDDFELIHAYFTPLAIADAIAEHVCPLLPELAGHDGVVRILEPSAGIGRFLRAMGRPNCIDPAGPVRGIEWVTVELSKTTSRLLTALRPDVRHHHMPFERFVREHGSEYAGRFHVILSNPPYGERGAFALDDPSPLYRERVAYAYFMRRALDMLVPGGLGVFIVPGGFLTGERNRDLRAKLLARHHLAAAFRLPSHTPNNREVFPGASVVVDVLFFRARGGQLTEIDEDDRFILDGQYYEHFPTHLLGKPAGELEGPELGDEAVSSKRPWRYKVVGEFKSIPAFEERPMCASCALGAIAAEEPIHYESGIRATEEQTSDLAEPLRAAVDLGLRIDRYLAAVAANDADRAEGMWVELRAALVDFTKRAEIQQAGGPWRYLPLRRHAERSTGAQQFLNAFTPTGELAPAIAEPPKVTRRYTGLPDDVLAQAEFLFRQRGHLLLPALVEFHRQVGGAQDRDAILARLLAADWNLDHDNEVVPLDVYVTGELWPKYDRARAKTDDPQAALQARRLLEAIGPAVFEDISDITPSQRWVPLDLVSAWLSATYNRELGPVALERVAGLVRVQGHAYNTTDDLAGLTAETVWILGWINHDKFLFDPDDDGDDDDADARRKKAELRALKAQEYASSFYNWLRDHEERRQRIADAYNREFKGIITPQFSGDPLSIARWATMARP
ncbi:Eco57I restriction-modification methylase domain-containing protein [Nannocystis bainbridge]|uniref:site-specific DNA-methyltransferase (adenine-specific) n=1 Tax=Nannocystis bainbridge TaxID=2995303 RepID=A0ABT5DRM3_9BACT|nr:Eco57I restriction-modification methylase domain-containing protein [Nannocystis bainbridge]MDC0716196.1 Eco57I restriction-modification methylase domain-containing protein [Nannocystis bainbridge]